MTKKQLKEQFDKELQDLLDKYADKGYVVILNIKHPIYIKELNDINKIKNE
jgi:hypothetical protein